MRKAANSESAKLVGRRRRCKKVTEVFEDCTITMQGNKVWMSGPLADKIVVVARRVGKTFQEVFIECVHDGLPKVVAQITQMQSKVKALGAIKKRYTARSHLQLFQLEKPATFVCSVRKVEVTSTKVALDLRTGELLSNGAYGQLLAGN